MTKNSRSNAAWQAVVTLQSLIERWNRGIKAVNDGVVNHQIALVRFAQLTDEIAKTVDGFEHVPEVEFLLNQWMGGDWENSPAVQREIQDFLNLREEK